MFSIIYSYNFNKVRRERGTYIAGELGTPGFKDIVFQEEMDHIEHTDRMKLF